MQLGISVDCGATESSTNHQVALIFHSVPIITTTLSELYLVLGYLSNLASFKCSYNVDMKMNNLLVNLYKSTQKRKH